MEILDKRKLNDDIISHRKALKGETGHARLDMGVFHEKKLVSFLLEDIEELGTCAIYDSVFKNGVFSNVDFARSMFSRTVVENCLFDQCSFVKSDIQGIKFVNCIFNESNFFRTFLGGLVEGCVFRNCKLDKMFLSDSEVKNTVFFGDTRPQILGEHREENVIWSIAENLAR